MTTHNDRDPELLDEYDFSDGVRGKYAEQYREGTDIVLLDDDVAAIFQTSEEVNSALWSLGKLIRQYTHADLAKPAA